MKSNGGNILNYLVKANQLGLSSTDATICNFSSFQCKQRDLQPRTLCGVVKPICPVLKFSCRLCNFYLSSKSCRKTCQTFEKYCGSSGCNSSSIISDNSKCMLRGFKCGGTQYKQRKCILITVL